MGTKEFLLQELPLVSVVVVTYNSANTIIETLESIKEQSYPNIELIISDDASTDDTIEKCRKWMAANGRKFLNSKIISSERNKGIPANCNKGIQASSGKFLKPIAGDDALMVSCLMDNVQHILIRPEIDIQLSQMEIYDTNFKNNCSLGIWRSDALTDFFPDEISAGSQYRMLLQNDQVGNTPSVFLRRSIFDRIGFYDEEFPWIEDYPFWLKATKAGIKIYFLDPVTVKYRQHSSSIHNNGNVQFMLPSFFKNEKIRQKYIYPNVGFWQRLHKKHGYNMALIFKFFTGNRYYPSVSKIYNLLSFQSNFYSQIFRPRH